MGLICSSNILSNSEEIHNTRQNTVDSPLTRRQATSTLMQPAKKPNPEETLLHLSGVVHRESTVNKATSASNLPKFDMPSVVVVFLMLSCPSFTLLLLIHATDGLPWSVTWWTHKKAHHHGTSLQDPLAGSFQFKARDTAGQHREAPWRLQSKSPELPTWPAALCPRSLTRPTRDAAVWSRDRQCVHWPDVDAVMLPRNWVRLSWKSELKHGWKVTSWHREVKQQLCGVTA